jgi:hypothetical protein
MVICKAIDCKKCACFGLEIGKAQFCKQHKTNEMYDVINKKCIKCKKKRPNFGLKDGKATHCGYCKEKNMCDINHKKCVKCKKTQPTFGLEDGKATHCKDCKEKNMYDVLNDKCIKCNIKQPTFGLEDGKATHCGDCKEKDMFDVINNKCIKCNIKQPIFGLEDGKATHCGDCKEKNMFDVKNHKCIKCNEKRPTFGLEIDIATHCGDCREKNMFDVINKKCIKCNIKQPTFGLIEDYPTHCINCKEINMDNVKDKKCNSNYLEKEKAFLCLIRGNPKYNGYCTHCFANLFPDDPLTKQIRIKSKELQVKDYINENFEGFIHDIPLWTGNCDCSHRRRIDHRKLIGNTLLCIETDENQHKYYDNDDEEIRYDDLMMLHGGKFIYIRFNPDKYTEKGKNKNPQIKTRLTALQKEIEKQVNRIENEENENLLEIVYMYYDN